MQPNYSLTRRGADPELVGRERELDQLITTKLNARIRLLTSQHSDVEMAAMDGEISRLVAERQDVAGQIRTRSPAYAALVQPSSLKFQEIQHLLDSDTILLEYSLGDERSFLWIVTANSITAYELPKRSIIEPLAVQVHHLLSRTAEAGRGNSPKEPTDWSQIDVQYIRAATKLGKMILGPAAPALGRKRLAIVSDGALHFISFAALILPSGSSPNVHPSTKSLDAINYGEPLMISHEIVNLPSASVLEELRKEEHDRVSPQKEVAVLADAVFDDQDDRIVNRQMGRYKGRAIPGAKALVRATRSQMKDGRLKRSLNDLGLGENGTYRLPRLFSTRKEATAIAKFVPRGKALLALDFDASRFTATSAELAQYRIVHFATHGLLNNEHPDLSGLVFSMVDRDGRPQNGFLQLEDIYNMSLPVDLVVLSACQTGVGRELAGEGIVGLTRGFMYAGAPRVIASLWNVDDEATAELMTRFYRDLEVEKLKPAAALRAAQEQMWRSAQWHSPYYWASFQMQGEWN